MAHEDWTYKSIENFYERVRLALNGVSKTTVPDEHIDYPEKAPFAEYILKHRIPLWNELPDEKFAIFEIAIIYQTAVFFQSLAASKYVKKKQIPTITLEYAENINLNINNMSFSDYVDLLVSELNGDNVGNGFIGFHVTKGGCR